MRIAFRQAGMVARRAALIAACVMLAGCNIAIGISNSPEWCMGHKNTVECP